MLTKILKIIFRYFPNIKGILWKSWYTYLGSKVITPEIRFMNYGYYSDNFNPQLSNSDEEERYPIQLYHYLCAKVNIKNLDLLEVGSGRGGGSDYILRTFKPNSVSAVDISKSAISLCKEFYNSNNIDFICASADNLPFEDNTFDLVLNVESSHCYSKFDSFLKEVSRVLKPSSNFLFTDFRTSTQLESFNNSILCYFDIVYEEEITENIIHALDLMSEKRSQQVKSFLPNFLSHISSSFAGVKGSELYQSFKEKELVLLFPCLTETIFCTSFAFTAGKFTL